MKKWIIILFILEALASFIIMFNQENYSQLMKMKNAGITAESHRVIVAGGDRPQEAIYQLLTTLADKYQANIYFTQAIKKSGKSGYANYVYITNPEYYQEFQFSDGSIVRLNNDSDQFFSTENTGDELQVGRLLDFAGDNVFEIKTLQRMLTDKILFEGSFIFQLKSGNFQSLLDDFHQNAGSLEIQEQRIFPDGGSLYFVGWIAIVFMHLVILLLLIYDLLSSYKKIAVEKMLGYSKKDIWLENVGPLLMAQGAALFIIFSLACVLKFNEYSILTGLFAFKLFKVSGLLVFSSLLLLSAPFLSISWIRISDMLKNKRPAKLITGFNSTFKVLCLFFFLVLGINVYDQYATVAALHKDTHQQWMATKEYVMIPILSDITNNQIISTEFREAQKELYTTFNQKGSILADFSEFTPGVRKIRLKEAPYRYQFKNASVNPNYLKVHPVYDIAGNQIAIEETETDYILLVPEHFRDREDELREVYRFWKNGRSDSSIVKNQQVRIIWVQDDQPYFTYRININPEQGNRISNIILRVLTESNGDLTDYDRILAYSGNPFKIKVTDPANKDNEIRPVLQKYNLNQYVQNIVSVYDAVAADVQQMVQTIQFSVFTMFVLGFIVVMLIWQNIYNYFEIHRSLLGVQTFLGYKKIDKYGRYFLNIASGWAIILILFILIKRFEFIQVLPFMIPLTIWELMISLFIIRRIEKNKLPKVLKGG